MKSIYAVKPEKNDEQLVSFTFPYAKKVTQISEGLNGDDPLFLAKMEDETCLIIAFGKKNPVPNILYGLRRRPVS